MGVNMNYNGIEINEFPLLFYTIFHTILLLTLIAVGVVGFFVFYDKDDKKAKKRMKALDAQAKDSPKAQKRLEKSRRKFKKHRKEKILAIVGIYGLLTVMFVLNSVFCVVPGWMDYAIKDYEIYEGEFETISSGRDRFIETEDGVTLFGNYGLGTEKNYYGEIVYGKRSKLTLGVRVSNGE